MKAYLVTTPAGGAELVRSQQAAGLLTDEGGTYKQVYLPSTIKDGLLGFINDLVADVVEAGAAEPLSTSGEREGPDAKRREGEGTAPPPATCPACARTPAAAAAIAASLDCDAVVDKILAAGLPALGRQAEAVADRFRELSAQAARLAAAGTGA